MSGASACPESDATGGEGMLEAREESQYKVAVEIADRISKLEHMKEMSPDAIVGSGDTLGRFLASRVRLKTNQIRRFLDAVGRIRAQSATQPATAFRECAMLLKPHLAYAAGRHDEVKPLMIALGPCMDRVWDREDFVGLTRFLDCILAYHRFYGGRD